jgi:hypothetical protein
MRWELEYRDLWFLVETLMPGRTDKAYEEALKHVDVAWVDAALDKDEVFERLTSDEEALLHVSPWLYFIVLLRRARHDMEDETFTMERRDRQKVPVFDTEQVIELLEQKTVQNYLASMLASFTRIASMTMRVRVREGLWRKYHTNDLDVEGLTRYSQTLDEPFRFEPYKRIADVCLFLAGMFPEHIEAQHRYPVSRQVRPRMRSRICQSREDYEAHGRAFYQLAAEHERARAQGLEEVLTTLSERFILAEKPLAFLSNRYLWFTKHKLFGI